MAQVLIYGRLRSGDPNNGRIGYNDLFRDAIAIRVIYPGRNFIFDLIF